MRTHNIRRLSAGLSAGAVLIGAVAIGAVPVATAATPPDSAVQADSPADKIVKIAQGEIGTKEHGDNCQKYSRQCVSWCSLFAMWTWEKAGVDVDNDKYAFTGDVYNTGKNKGTAYSSKNLKDAKPGDVLLFGTGPDSPSTSKHIGVVEKVDGDTVTTIEGNAGPSTDRVVREQHKLSAGTFYGGVHPW